MILQSEASKKSLRINDGDVEGNGGRGELAQFRVHVKRPGVVALQNVHESYNWLAIFQEQTIGTVRQMSSSYDIHFVKAFFLSMFDFFHYFTAGKGWGLL